MNRKKIGIYGMVPIALLQDDRVKPNMLKVYCALASFQGGNENCFPSVDAIAERAGIEPYAVSTATKELEMAGWIEKRRRSNARKTNVYVVLNDIDQSEENPDLGKNPKSEKSLDPAFSENFQKPSYNKKNNGKEQINTDSSGSKDLQLYNDQEYPPEIHQCEDDEQLKRAVRKKFLDKQLNQRFKNYPKENSAIKSLVKEAHNRDPDSPALFLHGIIDLYEKLRAENSFFGGQPFLPSALNSAGIFDRVLTEAENRWKSNQWREKMQQMDDVEIPL